MDNSQKNNPICPECDSEIHINSELKLGQVIECSSCGTECEILDINPLKLVPLEEEK
jgi:lysine biosynthesis protein LysW